jgi:hypothetical protein
MEKYVHLPPVFAMELTEEQIEEVKQEHAANELGLTSLEKTGYNNYHQTVSYARKKITVTIKKYKATYIYIFLDK